MKHEICAVRDRATDSFQRPFFCPALGAGIRAFADEVNRAESELCRHPDDYDLYHLGQFDDNTGQITCLPQPEQIAIGKQMLTKGGN